MTSALAAVYALPCRLMPLRGRSARNVVRAHKCGAILRTTGLRCRCRTPQQEGVKGTRQRSAKQELRRLEMDSYRGRFVRALEAELKEEMEKMKERIKTWPKKRLQDEGLALFDLSVHLDGQLYRDTVLRFYSKRGDGTLPYHQFSQGDVIAVSRRNPLDDEDSVIEGVVMERARRFLKVAVSSSQAEHLRQSVKWRLDLSANQVAFERCLWAVSAFSSPHIRPGVPNRTSINSNNSSKQTSSGISLMSLPKVGEGLLSFREIILGAESLSLSPPEDEMFGSAVNESNSQGKTVRSDRPPQSDALRRVATLPSQLGGKSLGAFRSFLSAFIQHLQMDVNRSQQKAIQTAMCGRMTLWQGPPGTGKTRTLVRLVKGLCQHQNGKVLACADSNVAVDNLVEGLLEQGLRVVRVGQPVKVKVELRESTLAAQVSAHPFMKRALKYREESRSKQRAARQLNNEKKRKAGAIHATGLWEKAAELEKETIKAVLDRADVIAATCVGAGDQVLDGWQFRGCVIDEATQATEPATLIPILRSGADTVVLVGDPAQLPPAVISRDAIEEGLPKSLFEHLQECGVEPILLNTQYRMHPFLASWPSANFYGNRLLSHVIASDRPTPKGLDWPNKAKPLVFMECASGMEQTTALGKSWFNHEEALKVVKVVKDLLDGDNHMKCGDIGVITPYNAQVRLLQDLFMEADGASDKGFSALEVKSVDGFQGREKEVIVISTVRSNAESHLGFVADPRRMNVALTRAKRGVIVVGHSKTLQGGVHWGAWLRMVKRENLLL